MKKILIPVLVVLTVSSLVFGYVQRVEASRMAALLERAILRTEEAEKEAKRQEAIANELRAAAEMAIKEARNAMTLAAENSVKRKP